MEAVAFLGSSQSCRHPAGHSPDTVPRVACPATVGCIGILIAKYLTESSVESTRLCRVLELRACESLRLLPDGVGGLSLSIRPIDEVHGSVIRACKPSNPDAWFGATHRTWVNTSAAPVAFPCIRSDQPRPASTSTSDG